MINNLIPKNKRLSIPKTKIIKNYKTHFNKIDKIK